MRIFLQFCASFILVATLACAGCSPRQDAERPTPSPYLSAHDASDATHAVQTTDSTVADADSASGEKDESTPSSVDSADQGAKASALLQAVVGSEPSKLDAGRIASISFADILEAAGDLSDPENLDRALSTMSELEDLRRDIGRRRAEELGWPVREEFPDGRVREVVGIDEDGRPLYYETHNVNAAISTGANLLQASPYQLTGTNLVLGMWDGGAGRTSHQEFAGGRMVNMNNVASINHATHVGGTMIAAGVDAGARGMAPAARVDSYDWNNDFTEMTSRGAAVPNEEGKIYISNHSYGFIRGWYWNGSYFEWYGSGTGTTAVDGAFGRYNTFARDVDALIFSKPYYTVFWSAGNDRADNPSTGNLVALSPGGSTVSYDPNQHPPGDGVYRGGYDIIADHAIGKNIITVGAVNDAVSGVERNVDAASMAWFSAWGPTDDGRIKPDLVANGVNLRSSGNNSNTHYYDSSGTSMSSPNAAGTAALLMEEYKRLFPGEALRASTLKGLLIHTADDLGNPGPDYRFGWGLINSLAAVALLNDVASRPESIRLTEAQIHSANRPLVYEAVWDGESPIRVTLSWTDPAGPATTATDNRTPRLVNNLDVKVIGPDGTEFLPYVMPFVGTWTQASMALTATTGTNNTDNVEQVFIAAPSEPGLYTIVVNYQGTLSNSPQSYSLFVSGMDVPLDPSDFLTLEGALDFGEVLVNTGKDRVVTLRNTGIEPVVVTGFNLPSGFAGGWTGTVDVAKSQDVVVRFEPTDVRSYEGSLVIELDGSDASVSDLIAGAGVLYLAITDPAANLTVPFDVATYDVAGTAHAALSGDLTWTNPLTSTGGSMPAATEWSVTGVPLGEGVNAISVSGTNQHQGTVLASDQASATWSDGDNGGAGFNSWLFQLAGANAGHFVATTNENQNLSITSPAWGLYASAGDTAFADRPLSEPLQIGDTFRALMENNWIDAGGVVGIALLNAAGESLFEFYLEGGTDFYRVNDGQAAFETALGYTDAGVELALTRTGSGTYDLTANALTLSRSFADRDDMQITRFRAYNQHAGPGSAYDFFFNHLEIERAAAEPETFSDEVAITRLGPPPDVPDVFIGQVEDTFLEAYWTAPAGATGYVFDVHTDASFTTATISTGGFEDFSGTGSANASYRTMVWTNNGVVWTAVNAKNDDAMTGPALTLRNGDGYLLSSVIDEDVNQISLDHRKFTGQPGGSIALYINTTNLIGTADLANNVNTALISDLAFDGPFTITVTNTGTRPAGIDNLAWTNQAVEVGTFVPGFSNLTTTATQVTVTGLEPGLEYFLRVKAVSENGESDYAVTNATTLGQARETQTITFDPIGGDIVTTNRVVLSATASSGLPVTFNVQSGPATLTNDNELVFSTSGSVTVVASQEGNEAYQPAPDVSRSFFVNKGSPEIVSPPEASPILNGQTLADSALNGGSADVDGEFNWLDTALVPPPGVSEQTVVFLPSDTNLFATTEATVDVTVLFVSVEINPEAAQAMTLAPLEGTNLTYTIANNGNTNLIWSVELFAYDFFDDVEQGNAGWTAGGNNAAWAISTNRAAQGTASWHSGYAANMFAQLVSPPIRVHTNAPTLRIDHWIEAEIEPDTATAYHGGLAAISTDGENFFLLEPDGGYPFTLVGTTLGVFSGFADWATATFDLSLWAGERVWVAFYFITDDFYFGGEEGWYIDNIAVSPQLDGADWISLSALDGSVGPEEVAELIVSVFAPDYLAGGSREAHLVFSHNDDSDPVTRRFITLDVEKRAGTVTLGHLAQLYDGRPKTATATTDPGGLAVSFTYDGSAVPPVDPGEYTVVGSIEDPAWFGAATGMMSVVELRGAIEVTDSIAPEDDHALPFGPVFVGEERLEQVVITNTNAVDALTVLEINLGYSEPAATGQVVFQMAEENEETARARRRAALRSDAPRDPDSLLVRFHPHARALSTRDAVHTTLGAQVAHRYRFAPLDLVDIPPGSNLTDLIAAYESRPDVAYAEPNFIYSPASTPNDPSFDLLWGLHNTGQSGGTPGADISAIAAWATTTGSTNVIVAVIDTGINYNHPDLAANMWVNPNPTFGDVYGARFISGNGQPTSGDPMDDHGHGTHVAGTIGAVGNNGVGVVGVAWRVRLMALKFITSANQGSLADAIASIEYAIEHGAHLSNNSWGGGAFSQALEDVIAAAGEANQLFVAAAGNDGANNDTALSYPASYALPNVLSVANSTRTDARAGNSNYGLNTVHLAAPGTSIYSTLHTGGYATMSGTSMAAPHVAGAAALLLAVHPNTPYAQLKNWILAGVTPLSNWENLVISGGRLNAAASLANSLENGFSLAWQPALPVVIPPGESVTLDVRFRPPAFGTYSNQLRVINNDLDKPELLLALSGEGISLPAVPAGFESTSHLVETWSTNRSVTLSWAMDDDGNGFEVDFYRLEMGNPAPVVLLSTSDLGLTVNDLADGTNWYFRVQAVDTRGNESAFTEGLGPFWIDATPPDSSSAVVSIQSSEFGAYTLSATLTNAWEGFVDALSGLAGYYVGLNDGTHPETNLWTVTTQAAVSGALWNETNHVFVWARDTAGNVSEPVSASILVLEPDAQPAGSLMTNQEKEIAGLNALDPDATFEGEPVQTDQVDEFGGVLPTLRWPWASNRIYRVIWSDGPLSPVMSWTTNSLATPDYAVENGMAIWTDTNTLQGVQNRYYRIQVQMEDP